MELVGLLAAPAIGLVAYGLLAGRRVIENRDGQRRGGENGEQGEVDRERRGACCGFGLPPIEQRKPARAGAIPRGDRLSDGQVFDRTLA